MLKMFACSKNFAQIVKLYMHKQKMHVFDLDFTTLVCMPCQCYAHFCSFSYMFLRKHVISEYPSGQENQHLESLVRTRINPNVWGPGQDESCTVFAQFLQAFQSIGPRGRCFL